jgi:hypothetical protein
MTASSDARSAEFRDLFVSLSYRIATLQSLLWVTGRPQPIYNRGIITQPLQLINPLSKTWRGIVRRDWLPASLAMSGDSQPPRPKPLAARSARQKDLWSWARSGACNPNYSSPQSRPGLMKTWGCTSWAFIPFLLRPHMQCRLAVAAMAPTHPTSSDTNPGRPEPDNALILRRGFPQSAGKPLPAGSAPAQGNHVGTGPVPGP